MVPNVITCSALISACDMDQQAVRALTLCEAVRLQGMLPKVITCSALIRACKKDQQAVRALKLFEAIGCKVIARRGG